MKTWVRRSVIAVASCGALVGAYALAGYYWVPNLVRDAATQWTQDELQKTLSLGEIAFDPFSLTLDIADLAIEGETKPMVSADRMVVDVEIDSLFSGSYHLREFTVEAPFVDAVLREDGSLNLIELIPETDPNEPMPSIKIDRLETAGGQIDFTDYGLPDRPVKALTPISFKLLDFETDTSDGGQFRFYAQSERAEALTWEGTAAMAPVASKGVFTLEGLQMETVAEFLADYLPVTLNAGSANFAANYDFSYQDGAIAFEADMRKIGLVDFAVTGGPETFNGAVGFAQADTSVQNIRWQDGGITAQIPQVSVRELSFSSSDQSDEAAFATIPQLQISQIEIDQPATRLSVESFAVLDPSLEIARARDGSINVMRFMPEASSPPASSPPASARAAKPQSDAVETSWTIALNEARVENANIAFEDGAVSPRARFSLTPVNLTMTDLSSDLSQSATLQVDGRMDGRTAFQGNGTLVPATASADVDFKLSNLSVAQLRSYLPAASGYEVRSAVFGASGKVRVANGEAAKARFNGQMSINNLAVHDTASDALLVSWRRFAFNGLSYAPGQLRARQAELVEPMGRLEILADGTYNITGATGFAPAPDEEDDADAPEANDPEGSAPEAQVLDAVENQPFQTEADIAAKAVADNSATNASSASMMPDIDVQVDRLDIRDGLLGFSDFSFDPNFQADIQSLSGSVTNITTNPGELTQVELEGFVVDRFSPATISGTMDAFAYDRQTDMKVIFRNIELPVFNPYSGRYAGYAIARGKLSADFHYEINDRALAAEHLVTIDQLKWGDPTEGQEKAPFPVRLAASLLKDKDGVIELDVPVNGTLDDPSFRMGPIIWKIIGNVLEKAITAPFRLLGSIFKGAEDAKYVDFAPGSSQLALESSESIAALASAMADREELMLDVPAGRGIREDAVAIADQRIDALMLAKEIEKGKEADLASLSVDKRYDRMKRIYKDRTGTKPEPPDYETGLEDGSVAPPQDGDVELEGGKARKYLETVWMREELRASFMPSDAELDQLGAARAMAVRDALLAGGAIAPERVFSNTDLAVSAFEDSARLELQIK